MKKCIVMVCLLVLAATAVSAGWQVPLKTDVIVVAQNDEGMGGERPAVRDRSGTDSVPMTTIPSDDSPRPAVSAPTPGSSRFWTDSVTGMRFVWIPGGCYLMGQTPQEKEWLLNAAGREKYKQFYADESPRHEVCVDGFWIGAFEVTRGQFARFINATNYRTDAERQGKAWVKDKATNWKWKEVRGRYWRDIGYDQNDNHPAVAISYNDAKAFISWLERSVGGPVPATHGSGMGVRGSGRDHLQVVLGRGPRPGVPVCQCRGTAALDESFSLFGRLPLHFPGGDV